MGAKLGLSRRLRFSKNRVLRKIFGPKRDEVTGEWRRLHTEEPNDLYYSPNVLGVIKSRCEMGGVCSTYGGERRCIQELMGKPRERDHLEDPDVDGRIILR